MCPFPVLIALTAYAGIGGPKPIYVNACAITAISSFNEEGRRPGTLIGVSGAAPLSVGEPVDEVLRRIREADRHR